MDSRKTTDGDGDERTTENVVRLPRDWLGPREELVPIGSRARAAETPDDAAREALPPTAASFWDEDSGSLQAPMQAPADAWKGQWEPASPEPAARVGSAPTGSAPTRLRRIPRPRRPRSLSGGFAPRRRRRTAAVAGVLGACLLVVLAVIGETAGGTHSAREKTAASVKSAAIVTATGVNRARLRAQTPVVTEIKTEPPSHHAVRSPTRKDRTHLSNHRHRHGNSVARSTPGASQPARSTTPATAPTPTNSTPSSGSTSSTPASGSTSSSPPASSARSTSSSGQHQPAFGPNGSLGPGSSPDG